MKNCICFYHNVYYFSPIRLTMDSNRGGKTVGLEANYLSVQFISYFSLWNIHYNTRLCANNSNIYWGGETPSPDPTPVGSYGAAIFAPAIHQYFMIDLWRVTSCVSILFSAPSVYTQEPSHMGGRSWGSIEPMYSFEIWGIDDPTTITRKLRPNNTQLYFLIQY